MKLPAISRQKKNPGAPPGQAVFVGDISDRKFEIEVVSYDEGQSTRQTFCNVGDINDCLKKEGKKWLHISGIHHTAKVERFAEALGLHRLSLEDILNSNHRPKIEFFDDHIIVLLKILEPKSNATLQQLTIVIMEDRVVTFSDYPFEFFSPVMKRLETKGSRIRRSPGDYLAWAILDLVVDHYLLTSEVFEKELDQFDDVLLDNSAGIDPGRLFAFKSEVNRLYRQIRPVREIVHLLKRSDSDILTAESSRFFDDLHDHIIHAIEDAEQIREQATEIRDFYLATVNNRMNEVMKMLTCFSAIFLPLTFLVGVYGMNFEHMPELSWKWSYPIVWCLFLASTALLIRFFKKRSWM